MFVPTQIWAQNSSKKKTKTLIATQELPPNSQKKRLAPWSSPSCPFPPALLALHRRTCPKPAARPGQTAWSFTKGFFIKMKKNHAFFTSLRMGSSLEFFESSKFTGIGISLNKFWVSPNKIGMSLAKVGI